MRGLIAAAVAGTTLVAAGAQAAEPAGAAATPAEGDWVVTFQDENEFFVPFSKDDRYYTQGFQLNVLTPTGTPFENLARQLPAPWNPGRRFISGKADVRGGFVLGQNIYTPEDLTREEPDPRDRPYAGWLYVGAEVIAHTPKRLDSLQLQIGMVGPSALGGWTQNNWHKHVNHIDEAKGWRYQLKDEVAFVLYGQRRLAPRVLWANPDPDSTLAVDFAPSASFALGTVQTSASVSGMLRFGSQLESDLGPPRIRPAPLGSSYFGRTDRPLVYGYLGAELKAVGRDIFLDGNTFQDSRRVDKRPFVAEAQTGVVARWGRWRATYSLVWRSEEFLGQNGETHFGAASIGYVAPWGRPF